MSKGVTNNVLFGFVVINCPSRRPKAPTRGTGVKEPLRWRAVCGTTSACYRCPEKPHKVLLGSACVRKGVRAGGVWSRAFVRQDRACTAQSESAVGRESYLQMSISTFSRGDNQVKGHPTHQFINSRALEGFAGLKGLQQLEEEVQKVK